MPSNDASNDDFERLLREARRLGFSVGVIAKTNEEIQHKHDEELFKQQLIKERDEMTDKAKWIGVLLTALTCLVVTTMWATKAATAGEEARTEIRQVENRVNEKIAETTGKVEAATALVHVGIATDGKQQAEIDAVKEDIKEIKETQAKTLEIQIKTLEVLSKLERRDR